MADLKNTKPKRPIPNKKRDKKPSPAYNKGQRQLQGNNDSGDPGNEDSIGIKDRLRSPPKWMWVRRLSSNILLL